MLAEREHAEHHQARTVLLCTHQSMPIPLPPTAQHITTSLSDIHASILRTCLHTGRPYTGKLIHSHALKSGLHLSMFLMNSLLNFYAKSGLHDDARKLFDGMPLKNNCSWNSMLSMLAKSGQIEEAGRFFDAMPLRDPVSWTTMIVGHSMLGCFEDAIRMFVHMIWERIPPSHYTFSNVLSACASLRCVDIGRKVHAFVVKMGMSGYVTIADSLLNMYGKTMKPETAMVVFDRMSSRSVSSWNTMISMFSQSGEVGHARVLFEQMVDRNVISWNAIIAGYNQNGSDVEALEFFSRMLSESSVCPDSFTFTNVLSACANLGMLDYGKQAHAHIMRTGIECNGPVGNALISMYSKSGGVDLARKVVEKSVVTDLTVISFTALLEGYVKIGDLEPARQIFNSMQFRDVVAWTAMIVGYVQGGFHRDAISLFLEMVRVGAKPNNHTFAAMLSVCSTLAAEGHGRQIHSVAIRSEEGLSVSVGNALITMYAKSGNISAARRVFHQISHQRQTVSWTSMIIALAQHGCGEEAIDLFETMLSWGIKPDHITYVGVISACTHVGLVKKGQNYFSMMRDLHSIEPASSHYACMIDLFARAGLLNEAWEFIEKMPMKPDAIAWGSLLAACKVHKNAEIAELAAKNLLVIEPENSGAYSALANVYSVCGRWNDAAKTWKLMRDRGVRKEQGFSWMLIKSTVHVFGVEDRLHPQREEIYEMAGRVWKEIKKEGFVPDFNSILHDIDDELKEQLLSHHSEKLAIAFGLLSTPEGTALKIMKNLRVCNDCHSAIKYISKVFKREIIVRDATRFHHFREGHCSCKDYW